MLHNKPLQNFSDIKHYTFLTTAYEFTGQLDSSFVLSWITYVISCWSDKQLCWSLLGSSHVWGLTGFNLHNWSFLHILSCSLTLARSHGEDKQSLLRSRLGIHTLLILLYSIYWQKQISKPVQLHGVGNHILLEEMQSHIIKYIGRGRANGGIFASYLPQGELPRGKCTKQTEAVLSTTFFWFLRK